MVDPARNESSGSPVADSGNRCAQCGYNLTGLKGDVCPECGWKIDWRLARLDEEGRRPGTPAHRARGWRRIDQTAVTVLMMLVTPWRFARQLRVDESIWPALVVAVLSFLFFVFVPGPPGPGEIDEVLPYVAAVVSLVLLQPLAFATLHRRTIHHGPRWAARFRLWLIVSLYTTCFVATWRWVGEPPVVGSLTETNFYWPLDRSQSMWPVGRHRLAVSIIFYWWWLILIVVMVIRIRPRWRVPLTALLVFLFAWMGARIALWTGDFIDAIRRIIIN